MKLLETFADTLKAGSETSGGKMLKYDHFIFDFDGTLFDSMFIWESVGEIYLRSLGKEPKSSLREDVRALSLYQSACYFRKEYDLPLSEEQIM